MCWAEHELFELRDQVGDVLLWVYLSAESTRYGIIWFVIGIVVLLWITRSFRRPLTINMGEAHCR